jgi:hypothetical protein
VGHFRIPGGGSVSLPVDTLPVGQGPDIARSPKLPRALRPRRAAGSSGCNRVCASPWFAAMGRTPDLILDERTKRVGEAGGPGGCRRAPPSPSKKAGWEQFQRPSELPELGLPARGAEAEGAAEPCKNRGSIQTRGFPEANNPPRVACRKDAAVRRVGHSARLCQDTASGRRDCLAWAGPSTVNLAGPRTEDRVEDVATEDQPIPLGGKG